MQLFLFPVFTYNAGKETCEHNHGRCSRHAFCTDYATGFCCHCQSRFYGNGQQCLPEGEWRGARLLGGLAAAVASSSLWGLCLWTLLLHSLSRSSSCLQGPADV